jgi:23S rRNA (guanosine2251-2'-O)-methyltransferase
VAHQRAGDHRGSGAPKRSPRESFITVYGRKPVQEVLLDDELALDKLVVAENVSRPAVKHLLELAKRRGVPVEWATPQHVKRLAGNGKHDQGIVADVVAPGLRSLEEFARLAPATAAVLVLDGVTNPANVGMIIRTATAAGFDAIVLPSAGSPGVGPLVIKASAGIAYRASIVRCRRPEHALQALRAAGYTTYGLDASARESIYDARLEARSAFVLGNETDGLSDACRELVDVDLAIPMHGGVESLNVASSAAVLAFEVARRRLAGST